jgi:hypothetical protein
MIVGSLLLRPEVTPTPFTVRSVFESAAKGLVRRSDSEGSLLDSLTKALLDPVWHGARDNFQSKWSESTSAVFHES